MPGSAFCWYELLTSDVAAAEAFYGQVIGWGAQAMGTETPYTLFTADAVPVAGLMTLPQEARDMGARPSWIGYIAVDDVDAIAIEIAKRGGQVHRAAEDIANVGRFAVVADPQGASFVLFKAAPGSTPAPDKPETPGYPSWRELMAGDLDTAFAFYADLFGWTKDQAVDMGPMGVYQLFAVEGKAHGGMMTKPPVAPAPFWTFYFTVESIEAAVARVKGAGGQIVNGPHQVPGGSWIVQGLDPQGVLFALTSGNA